MSSTRLSRQSDEDLSAEYREKLVATSPDKYYLVLLGSKTITKLALKTLFEVVVYSKFPNLDQQKVYEAFELESKELSWEM